jgi:hypothetical protein
MSSGCSHKFTKKRWGSHVVRVLAKIAKNGWGSHVLRVLSNIECCALAPYLFIINFRLPYACVVASFGDSTSLLGG